MRAYATNSAGTSYGAVQTFRTATTIVSLARANPPPTAASTVDYILTFATPVTGVSANNFTLLAIGLSLTGIGIRSITGSGTTYTITAGSGTLQLQFTNSANLTPMVASVPFMGETYTIDRTAPSVTLSSLASATKGPMA